MNIMDHEQAIKTHAAERYLLDELSQEERDDFEEHYFSCMNCADEVQAAFVLADNAKAVFSQQPLPAALDVEPAARPGWLSWLQPVWAPAAAALLLAVTLYQSAVVIPGLNERLSEATEAQVVPTVVARPATRGDDPVVVLGEKERFVNLVLDINTTPSVSSYVGDVRDDSGALRFTVPVPVPTAGASLNLLLPASGLQSGRYEIAVRPSGAGSESATQIEKYTFVLQRQ